MTLLFLSGNIENFLFLMFLDLITSILSVFPSLSYLVVYHYLKLKSFFFNSDELSLLFLKDFLLPIFTFLPEITIIWEKAMAPHSSTLAWKIPWTEEPGRLQSMGSLRVGHD